MNSSIVFLPWIWQPDQNLGGVYLTSLIQRFSFPVNQLPAAPGIPRSEEASSVGGFFFGMSSLFCCFSFPRFWPVDCPGCPDMEGVEVEGKHGAGKVYPNFSKPGMRFRMGSLHVILKWLLSKLEYFEILE